MKKICNIILGIIILIFTINIFILVRDNYNKYKLKEKEEIVMSKINEIDNMEEKFQEIKNYYKNDGIVARVVINDLKIYNLVAQSNDNDYYLNHNLYRESDSFGNIFMDYRNDLNTSKQINIYGHNSHYYDVPFSRLDAYLDEEYYLNNKYIYLETTHDIRKYEIFAVYGVFKNDNEHMALEFNSEEDYNKHFNNMKNKSIYDTEVLVEGNDYIITIQTCLYNYEKGNYLVINAKEIERY